MSTKAFFTSLDLTKEGSENFVKAITNYDSSKNNITPIESPFLDKKKSRELSKIIHKKFSIIIGEK